tara:strand:+ start:287 stop:1189 length:903 start_codon:yes stop_codon:yes gene_type:complete
MTTTLTTASGYNPKDMIFSKPEVGNIPGSALTFKRIRIGTKNPDGTTGDLIIPTHEVFSFGVQENTDMNSGAVNGHVMPLCLWNKNGASDEEREWTDTFDQIVENCKDHVMNVKDEIEKYDLEKSDLKKLNPLYWKREKGKIVEGMGPTLYAKLLESKKTNSILTLFTDSETNEDIDPLGLKKQYCYVTGAIKFESIFIGNKISLQVKLYEAVIRKLSSGPKRLLRPNATQRVTMKAAESVESAIGVDDDSGDESEHGSVNGSISGSGSGSESEEDAPQPVLKKTPVKRVVKKRVVKKSD